MERTPTAPAAQTKVEDSDIESQRPARIPHLKQVLNQRVLTKDIIEAEYPGSGTEEDPYIITWIDDDPRNPMLYAQWKKWALTLCVAFATLAVAFVSSAYSGGVMQIIVQFHASQEVVTLGIALFVLGFAIGPLLWAPLSELFGRQYLFIGTYAMLTFFNAGACASQNIWTLIILRFFAGAFGSSPLTNAGGVIADMFPASERGIAMTLFASAPFMGPVLGPIIGGFVGETIGWRWIEGIMAIFTGLLWIFGSLVIPETYPPVLLRQRAVALTKLTGKVYVSRADAEQGKTSIGHAFKTSLTRPWILLLREPIVLLLSVYMAIIYGTLYMLFAAFPIVYEETRGWSQGISGLAFIGVMVGMIIAMMYSFYDNKRYIRAAEKDPSGFAPPEARLPPCIIGGCCVPIGLFWFAWTNSPSVHWIVSIMAGAPFGFGMVLVFLSVMNYLIDAYVIFAASVLAANSVLRSVFGAVFPLFTTYMYQNLGIHWASSIPAFLALMCVPFPFLFYKYGEPIRQRCKFAAEADAFMKRMREQVSEGGKEDDLQEDSSEGDEYNVAEAKKGPGSLEEATTGDERSHKKSKHTRSQSAMEKEAEKESEAIDYSYDDKYEEYENEHDGRRASQVDEDDDAEDSHFASIRAAPSKQRGDLKRQRTLDTIQSNASRGTAGSSLANSVYNKSPFDLDRYNTKESFGGEKRRNEDGKSLKKMRSSRSNLSKS